MFRNYVTTNADQLRTEIIDNDCAILRYNTDEKIEGNEKELGEDYVYIVADDINWYQANAIPLIHP